MRFGIKHAFVIVAVVFLVSAPLMAASGTGAFVAAQDLDEDFLFQLLETGAEVVFANIDPQGEPIVVYGQLGVPSDELGLSEPMYDGCIAMALVATQGELLEYIMDLVGPAFFNFTGDGDYGPTQFGDGESFDLDSIFDMLGTDFNLMFNVFINTEAATAANNMALIQSHMATEFGFSFSLLLDLRIDESFFPPEMNVTLPFESIEIYINQVTNTFASAINSVLGVMDDSGFLGSIDSSVFAEARASGAGILAVPDMAELITLIDEFTGGETPSPMSFLTAQMPYLEGPMAIAAAGYIGDQILASDSDHLSVFEDLLGKSPSGTVSPLDTGQSLVVMGIPSNLNLTSYSPEDEALNLTHYDNSSGMVFWNATAYASVSDYVVHFNEGDFPPLVTIERTFTPDTTTPGGSVLVTVTVTNHGTEPVYNVTIHDDGFAAQYLSTTVTGDTNTTTAILPGGSNATVTYTVQFSNEGSYAFDKAILTYEYGGETFVKSTHIDGYVVSADPLGLLSSMISDGWPFTGIALGVVGLGAIINILMMVRAGSASKGYQV
ncbi:MAG: hypothetical protein ACP6KW_04020 [Candidatus Thorarchaeota archaeon]